MIANVKSSVIQGVDAFMVDVEVDISYGLPAFNIVGLPDMAVRESRERVRSAIINSDFKFPPRRYTINLAPADIRKEGPVFDLPMALGILGALGYIDIRKLEKFVVIGELSLNGTIKPVNGILSMALMARKNNIKMIIVPQDNRSEASLVDGLKVISPLNIQEAMDVINNDGNMEVPEEPKKIIEPDYKLDFSDVKGQEHAKRALEIAAAGGHNIIMTGPPGSGKTMLAVRVPSILPPMSWEEAIDVTKIYSVAGMVDKKNSLITERPFRSPHHSISNAGLIGGGSYPRPGEVSLSHNGVLFLDELPEFNRDVLELLRQPLEDGKVTISRAIISLTYPADFMLIAAMNPCPCGFYSDSLKKCSCSEGQVNNYMKKISGPLIDRFDIYIEVPRLNTDDIIYNTSGTCSKEIRRRVVKSRDIQYKRFRNKFIFNNGQMSNKEINIYCNINKEIKKFLKVAVEKLKFSARGYHRILKLSRTIADLAGREDIIIDDVAEAIQYRSSSMKFWN